MKQLPLLLVAALISGTTVARADEPKGPIVASPFLSRSVVDVGSPIRIRQALARARRGEPVTIGVIGGSITQGAKASTPDRRWGEQVGAWWRERFPQSQIRFVNAGIGATGSNLGAHRVQADLLAAKPDFVVAEYAVNDPDTPLTAETLEGLLRQILASPSQPGMMLLFTMSRGGNNCQARQIPVGKHYGLPMVSFRDAMWPEIEAGRMKWDDLIADEVHPNDVGHKLCADFVTAVLDDLLAHLPEDAALLPISPLPEPLYTDLFQFTALHNAATLKPATNQGWTLEEKGPFGPVWVADAPGSILEYRLSGEQFTLIFHRIRKDMGRIKVTLDDLSPAVFDAWFSGTWGGYSAPGVLPRVPNGEHRLRIELLADKAVESGGTHFVLQSILIAGHPTPPAEPQGN